MRVRWLLLFVLAATVLGSIGLGGQAAAAPASPVLPVPGTCTEIDRPNIIPTHDARWKICVPAAGWNGDVVLWAHGYVIPGDPAIFQDVLDPIPPNPDPISLPVLVQSLGYAFAATTYPTNGLGVLDAKADLLALADYFNNTAYPENPAVHDRKVYLVGASMGGLIATQLAEQTSGTFDGALAACGIVGDFRRHTNYWGDFRVLFNYFYPGLLASLPSLPPPSRLPTTEDWRTIYAPIIGGAILTYDPTLDRARQLLAVSKAPVASATPGAALETILSLLYYSVLSVDDASARLGGNPFDNSWRWYWGSDNDWLLNRSVSRTQASWQALIEMKKYETTGRVRIPIVMPHTIKDPIVPFNQTLIYWLKARPVDKGRVTPLPVARYGHCRFTSNELVLSFAILVLQTTGKLPLTLETQIADLDLTGAEAELADQLQAFQDSEALDARMQTEARWSVYLPQIIR